MAFRPLYDRVLVRRIEADAKTAGGIYIPDSAQKKTTIMEVIAVGEGRLLKDGSIRPLAVKVGDRILVASEWTGSEVEVDGEKVVFVKEEEILGVEA